MKSLILIGIIVIAALILPTICADPSIIIYDYELTPKIFMPGDYGTLKLTIKNAETTNTIARTTTGSTTTTVYTDMVGATFNNIWIVAASDSYSKDVKATLNYEDTGYLAPSASFDITFKMIAEAGITEGLYFPTVRIDIDTYTDVSFPIPINVSNATVDLISTSVPSKLSVSGSTDITLTAVNNRAASIDSVKITPQETTGIEFMPSSIFIGSMSSYDSEDVIFSIKPTETGEKNLSFDIDFKNGDNLHTRTLTIPMEIVETLDVAPVFYSIPSSIEKGKSTRIRLEVFNAKTSGITGVIVTPITDAKMSPSQYFIGAMDPDDVFSASFDMYTDGLEIGNYTIGFKVSFKQGEDYFETPTVSSSFKIVAATENSGDGSLGVVIGGMCILVVALVLFLIWRKRRIIK
ncbi:MAG: hypothetical protein KAW47_10520 [Thermoplasmatales archaeon]|nr:hypothetical protein [Thermoplasmatales archaeon]